MELYLIGALFTLGYLMCIDKQLKGERFSGFKGTCTLFLLTLIWPTALGYFLASIQEDTEKNDA